MRTKLEIIISISHGFNEVIESIQVTKGNDKIFLDEEDSRQFMQVLHGEQGVIEHWRPSGYTPKGSTYFSSSKKIRLIDTNRHE